MLHFTPFLSHVHSIFPKMKNEANTNIRKQRKWWKSQKETYSFPLLFTFTMFLCFMLLCFLCFMTVENERRSNKKGNVEKIMISCVVGFVLCIFLLLLFLCCICFYGNASNKTPIQCCQKTKIYDINKGIFFLFFFLLFGLFISTSLAIFLLFVIFGDLLCLSLLQMFFFSSSFFYVE